MSDSELTLVTIAGTRSEPVSYQLPPAPASVHNSEIIPLHAGEPFAGQARLA